MRVLVLNGSPRGESSNTMHLTRAFLDGAQWQDAEIIDVTKSDVKPCLGCFTCWNKTPGKCVINDSMNVILSKMMAADVIIWSFPLYYFNIPGGLKNLIDRQLPLELPFMAKDTESGGHPSRYDLAHQKHIVISTCGFWTVKGNYDAIIPMFDRLWERGNYTSILCSQGELFSIPELKNRTNTYLEIVHRAGAEYVTGRIHPKTQMELSEPLYPQDVFEKMADASWTVTKSQDSEVLPDDSLNFTTQMAALYIPDGAKRVLEFYYNDIDKSYQILMTKQGATVVTYDFKPYTTKIETPYALWRSISRGEISGQDALYQGLYKVLGDFSLMLKWDDLFGASVPPNDTNVSPNCKTNMTILLFPWIAIWVAIAINPTFGALFGIVTASCIPLLWLKFRSVVYEQISIPIVIGLSLSVLFGASTRLIISSSYLIFGLMWTIGAFPKIPLTAYYSAARYGEERAYANPLFITTNRILTIAWGILYLVTPIWTYILMGTSFSPYIGLINSVLPAMMGVFTAWFQKWYPARWARG